VVGVLAALLATDRSAGSSRFRRADARRNLVCRVALCGPTVVEHDPGVRSPDRSSTTGAPSRGPGLRTAIVPSTRLGVWAGCNTLGPIRGDVRQMMRRPSPLRRPTNRFSSEAVMPRFNPRKTRRWPPRCECDAGDAVVASAGTGRCIPPDLNRVGASSDAARPAAAGGGSWQ